MIMHKTKLLFILIGIPFISYATVSNGPYVGLELGTANQIVTYQPSAFDLNTNGSQLYNPNYSFLGRVNLGYNVDKYNGFELGTSYFFSSSSSYPNGNGSMSTNTTSLDLSYLLYLPISSTKISVFGRLGFAYDWINNANSGGCGCGTSSNLNPSGSNLADVIGAGLKYNIGPHTSFRIEWIANGLFFPVGINNGSQNIASWTAQTYQAGINYHF
jgi:hypothetical protein